MRVVTGSAEPAPWCLIVCTDGLSPDQLYGPFRQMEPEGAGRCYQNGLGTTH